MKNGQSNKQSKNNPSTSQEMELNKAIHTINAPKTERDIIEMRENERFADFDHRVRFEKAKYGEDAIVEASDEIIGMLLSSVVPFDPSNPNAKTPQIKEDGVPYMHYNGVMVTRLGWTEKVQDYMNTDWEALKHPGDVVAKSSLTGR